MVKSDITIANTRFQEIIGLFFINVPIENGDISFNFYRVIDAKPSQKIIIMRKLLTNKIVILEDSTAIVTWDE